MDQEAWWATVHGVTKSWTRLSDFTHTHQDFRASQVVLVVKNPLANAGAVREVGLIPGEEDPLEEEMAAHSNILAWSIPWTEEPGGLQSMGSKELDTTEMT